MWRKAPDDAQWMYGIRKKLQSVTLSCKDFVIISYGLSEHISIEFEIFQQHVLFILPDF